jgi:HPt (histidine-containing phosphotransfer) domain-containing protein
MSFKKPEIDPDLLPIIPDFIFNTVKDFNSFEGFIEKKDYEGMRKICHTILGTAVSYGFEELDEIVTKVQKAAVEQDEAALATHFEVFKNYIQFLKVEFPSE